MDFDFSDDQKLLKQTAADYLREHSPLSVCRAVLESDASYSEALWTGIAQMGWLGTAIPEEYGGAGFGDPEMAVIAEEVGAALAPIPFSSTAYLASEAILQFGSEAQKQKYLPAFASGECIGTFAHAERPGRQGPKETAAKWSKGKLNGTKTPVVDGDVAQVAVTTAKKGKDVALVLVDLTGPGVDRRPLRSLDPSRSVAEIRFDAAAAELLGEKTVAGWDAVQRLFDRAAVLMVYEQLGGARRAFDMTREYCMERYAFGGAIASFQAIKHRLADLYVELELGKSNAYYGAWALSHDSKDLPVAACGARTSASSLSSWRRRR
jgi:alkylation response protein AidB-like acyl-CoA dehydrogenase